MKKNYKETVKTEKLTFTCFKYCIRLLRTDMKAVVSNELLVNENR